MFKLIYYLIIVLGVYIFFVTTGGVSQEPKDSPNILHKIRALLEQVSSVIESSIPEPAQREEKILEKKIEKVPEIVDLVQKPQTLGPRKQGRLRVGSFYLSSSLQVQNVHKRLGSIVDLVGSYDVLALQNVHNRQMLNLLKNLLKRKGHRYYFQISPPVGGKAVPKHMAFIYDSKRVDMLQDALLYEENDDEFVREPYYAHFKSGQFDFKLINVHMPFKGTLKQRRAEIEELATVREFLKGLGAEEDLIVLGCFYAPPKDKSFGKLRRMAGMMPLIFANTVRGRSRRADNIWLSQNYTGEYLGVSGVQAIDPKQRWATHHPVWAEFDTLKADDD